MSIAEVAATGGQGWRQVGDLSLAFALTSIIGLERQFRGKSAGLRTQSIVGTASALILLVGKYGFDDVLGRESVVLDPSRVAAQIVSGIGFLGAGLIITRRGAIRGLTTAASVWEAAAIGMAAGAGLPILALVVTGLHFVIVLAYTPLGRFVASRGHAERSYTVTYLDNRGVLRELLAACTAHAWRVQSMSIAGYSEPGEPGRDTAQATGTRMVTVTLTILGPGATDAAAVLGELDGVVQIDAGDTEDD
ncbi:MgtC/SapB family protein [Nocardioides humi]|nr:MgtC/SapB family protein [Nocardioides humi]